MYAIDGGQLGKQRLDMLARVFAPGTAALLDRVGIRGGAHCLDLGCGGGHVSRELAARVGNQGRVVGIDMDATVVALARADAAAAGIVNVEFRCGDAARLNSSTFDIAYARFLLSHLANPSEVVAAMVATLKPGGVTIVEDIDFTGFFCHPPCRAFDRYVELYRETVRRRGGNADLGPTLPSLLLGAGMEHVDVAVYQPCALTGEAKLLQPLTLTRIAEAIASEGVTNEEDVAQAVAELEAYAADPTTVIGARLVQAWGSAPTR